MPPNTSMKCPLTSADSKSSPTLLMLHSGKTFHEHICNYVFCWHKLELEQSLFNLLPESVIHHINVLHSGVVFRILGHSNGRLAVTVDGEFGNVISKFSQQLPQPHRFMSSKVGCHIFSIRGGGGYCGLSLAAPADCSSTNEKGIASG